MARVNALAVSWEIFLARWPIKQRSGSHMKKLVAHVTALTLLAAGSAVAADMRMPVKAPPPVAPLAAYNWTGCYVGAGGGYGMFDQESRFVSGQTTSLKND